MNPLTVGPAVPVVWWLERSSGECRVLGSNPGSALSFFFFFS